MSVDGVLCTGVGALAKALTDPEMLWYVDQVHKKAMHEHPACCWHVLAFVPAFTVACMSNPASTSDHVTAGQVAERFFSWLAGCLRQQLR